MGMTKLGDCSGECGCTNVPIVNVKYGLCGSCNRLRIDNRTPEAKLAKVYTFIKKASSSIKPIKRTIIKPLTTKGVEMIKKDEEFYEKVWNSKEHNCEECDRFLGDEFRDDNGKVIDRFRYSHILPKGGRYGQFRHRLENMNLLCLDCHQEWEHGIKEDMKIYVKNIIIMEDLYEEMASANKW